MKKICIAILLILFLSACSPKITSGEVYDKEYKEAFVTVSVYPVVTYNGKTSTTIMVPYTVYYPERWVIFIKSFEDGEWITEDFYVSESVYNSISIGDMFEYDENRGDLTDEPHTKISIHAPREGSDACRSIRAIDASYFNPRSP